MGYQQRVIPMTASVASTASTTTAYTAVDIGVRYQALGVIASLVGLTGGVLDIYLQDSFDEGVTWFDCAHFTQVAAAGTVKQAFSLSLDKTPLSIGIGSLASPGVALAPASVRAAPWGPKLRLVSVSGSGTSGAAALQTIYLAITVYDPS